MEEEINSQYDVLIASHHIKNKKILITGADGFIGSSLKDYFINSGFQVFGTTFFRTSDE